MAKLEKELPKHLSRGQLIEAYSPLVKLVAYKIAFRLPSHVDLDDLISSGIIGLIDAIDKYDGDKSNNFKKYAEIRIRGAILDELRSMDWVSRSVRRKTVEMDTVKRRLATQLGRAPSDEELATELGLDITKFHQLANKIRPILVVSFDDLGLRDDKDKRVVVNQLRDSSTPDPSVLVNFVQVKRAIADTLELLPQKQKIVISLYYFEEMNLKEIGKVLEVSESRVSQLHSAAVQSLRFKLRKRFGKQLSVTDVNQFS